MPKSAENRIIMIHVGDVNTAKKAVKTPVELKEGLEIPEKALPWVQKYKPEWIEGSKERKALEEKGRIRKKKK